MPTFVKGHFIDIGDGIGDGEGAGHGRASVEGASVYVGKGFGQQNACDVGTAVEGLYAD